MPYKRPMTKKGFFRKMIMFMMNIMDEYYDCYICPNDKILEYSIANREGYKEYKSNWKDCMNCHLRNQCIESKNTTKIVTRHI